jgi:hypothetical protein
MKPIVDFKPYNIPDKEDKWELTRRCIAYWSLLVVQKAANPYTTRVVSTLKTTRKWKVVEL